MAEVLVNGRVQRHDPRSGDQCSHWQRQLGCKHRTAAAEVLVDEKDPKRMQALIGEEGPSCRHLLGESDLKEARRCLFALLDEPERLAALAVRFRLGGEGREDLAWLDYPFATSREAPEPLTKRDVASRKPSLVDHYKVALHPELLLDATTANAVLLSVASHADRGAVETETVLAVVDSEWRKVWPQYLFLISFRALGLLAALACACSYREGRTPHAAGLAVLWLDLLSWVLLELAEVRALWAVCAGMGEDDRHQAHGIRLTFRRRACQDVLVFVFLRVPATLAFCGSPLFGTTYVAADIGLRWCALVYSLRGLHHLGPKLLTMINAVRSIQPFFLVVLFCLAGFSSAYWVLDAQSGVRHAFLIISRLGLLGDFDMLGMQGLDLSFRNFTFGPAFWIFFSVSVAINIVLLNLLIGIMSNTYDACSEMAGSMLTRERAVLTFSLRSAGRLLPWLFRQGAQAEGGPIYLCKQRVVGGVSQVNSMREFVQKKHEDVQKRLDKFEERFARFEELLQRLETKLDASLQPQGKPAKLDQGPDITPFVSVVDATLQPAEFEGAGERLETKQDAVPNPKTEEPKSEELIMTASATTAMPGSEQSSDATQEELSSPPQPVCIRLR